jgi:hypothetical protein
METAPFSARHARQETKKVAAFTAIADWMPPATTSVAARIGPRMPAGAGMASVSRAARARSSWPGASSGMTANIAGA